MKREEREKERKERRKRRERKERRDREVVGIDGDGDAGLGVFKRVQRQ